MKYPTQTSIPSSVGLGFPIQLLTVLGTVFCVTLMASNRLRMAGVHSLPMRDMISLGVIHIRTPNHGMSFQLSEVWGIRQFSYLTTMGSGSPRLFTKDTMTSTPSSISASAIGGRTFFWYLVMAFMASNDLRMDTAIAGLVPILCSISNSEGVCGSSTGGEMSIPICFAAALISGSSFSVARASFFICSFRCWLCAALFRMSTWMEVSRFFNMLRNSSM